ncbi:MULTISPECIES: polysaccharide pyruvyl transferase family protein [Aequorivita]|uniref:Polysaccharide pyruvyl transferase family protein n=1 Tax=Aequorivita iocasae TaxID=2803865 RepID=A0ABX7DQ50_9FLAO|nr:MULTISPECIES: polysaccharide pyruvyl transferase family protein [Aequorivita]QQX75955.1 polysaccharide pyruvyl transferase family protein [Aequorivita iocasae]UCA55416.1 polysaccharide pyruvyl transferase family protein [Aequorivita sp. F7]
MKRKIAILTQPLHDNYGGLLQAYALSKTLNQYGDVLIINRWGGHNSYIKKFASKIKHSLIRNPNIPTKSQKAIISQHTNAFREKYIPNISQRITTDKGMREHSKMGFNTYVVGSDQCWRPNYSPKITNFFLDFVRDKQNLTRISYAASFGTSEWEFNDEQTKICKDLIQKFEGVSVRESSGVQLCKNHLNSDAIHVLDPTMLLDIEEYKKLTESENVSKSMGNLKVYVLDKSVEKTKLIEYVTEKLNLKSFEVMPDKRMRNARVTSNNVNEFIYPSPLVWLKGFQDAEFVITDSFHGTVFSILHNLPFIAIGNERRGLSRFESLLQMFGLEDRLLIEYNIENANEILKRKIKWSEVNNKLEKERKKAKNFLNTYLK